MSLLAPSGKHRKATGGLKVPPGLFSRGRWFFWEPPSMAPRGNIIDVFWGLERGGSSGPDLTLTLRLQQWPPVSLIIILLLLHELGDTMETKNEFAFLS